LVKDCVDEGIEHRLWHKLAISCTINPLSARHECVNGQVFTFPGVRRGWLSDLANLDSRALAPGNVRLAQKALEEIAALVNALHPAHPITADAL
jgi:ketopantoate reductase